MNTDTRSKLRDALANVKIADNMVHVTISALTDGGGTLYGEAYADVLTEAVSKLCDAIVTMKNILEDANGEDENNGVH